MGQYALTPQQQDAAIEHFQTGRSMESIAKKYGVNPATIRRLVKARGLTTLWRDAPECEPTRDDLIYLAGLFDGEGCIIIFRRASAKGTPGHSLRITIANSHLPTLQWIRTTFGGTVHLNKCPQRTDPLYLVMYYWSVPPALALRLLRQIVPYLRIKKEQAIIGIEFQEHIEARKQSFRDAKLNRFAPSPEEIDVRESFKDRLDESKGQRGRKRRGPVPKSTIYK